MDFYAVLAQMLELLQREGRVSYRALKVQFNLDDDQLEALKDELIEAKRLAVDERDRVLVWSGAAPPAEPPTTPAAQPDHVVQSVPLATTPSAPDAERRQLTVLFCDLVDSTKLAQQLDPEDYRAVVRAYQEAAVAAMQPFDGYVAQYLGDGLLIYFGYPQAHEDAAQRAVRAGLAMVDAMAPLNTRLEPQYGVCVAVRLGLHTGVAVVGSVGSGARQEQLAMGDTPNIAARLQGLAAPNTVVLSAVTVRLLHGAFALEDIGVQQLKGVTEPMAVCRVLGPEEPTSDEAEPTPARLPFLVGREAELGLLLRRWEQSKARLGQVVLLSGEAGIGKTALVEALRAHVGREGHTRVRFRGSPYHTHSALYPVIEHLRRLLLLDHHDSSEAALDKLERVLQGSGLPLAEIAPLLAALLAVPLPEGRYAALTLTPQQQRQQTLDALVAWLVAEADRRPVLAVYEDVHWADPSTLELLGMLVEQAPTVPMLHVLAFRPDFVPPWSPRAHITPLTLNRLDRPQVEALIQHLTGGKALPAEVVQHIVTRTDGVPLFVEELTRMLLESGLLHEEETHYVLTGPLASGPIPATLHDALMARLDRLGAAKAVAQLGAVLGREFAYTLIQALAPLDEATLQVQLGQLVAAEILYQRGRPPRATYRFKHALIQDAAYASLLKSTRQPVHQQVAQVLEAQFPETVATQPERVAQHYTEAGLTEQALPYWQQAGQQAMERSAYVEAVAHLTKGLAVLQQLPETIERARRELDLHLMLTPALMATRGSSAPETGQALTRARELCQRVGDTQQLCAVLEGLVMFYLRREVQTSRVLGEQLLTLAQRQHDLEHLASAHSMLGQALFYLGELVPARAHLDQALTCSAASQPAPSPSGGDARVAALGTMAWVLWMLGSPDQALARSHEMLTYAQELRHPLSLARALFNAATLHKLRGEAAIAQEWAEAALAIMTEQGFMRLLGHTTFIRGWALAAQGQHEEGMAQMHQGLAARRELAVAEYLARLAEASGRIGQAKDGLRLLAEALVVMDKRDCWYEAELHRIKGELLLRQAVPDAAQAEACFQQALAIARRQQAKSWELRAALSLSRLWQQQGKCVEARELLAPIYGWFTEGFDTADVQDAKALLEELS
jgi:class 3 adenylate cyclase/predicted ATPase/tRNA A37 threonylcarbamoyladenosine biosynthesis protein TsaE